jgi:8-oxo-dGTP diphosphatase
MLQRTKQPFIGHWVVPGGKVEANESPLQTMIRECQEETGLLIDNWKLISILSESSPIDYNWVSYLFKAELPSCLDVVAEAGGKLPSWIGQEEMETLLMPEIDRIILPDIIADRFFIKHAVHDADMKLIELYDI